MRVGYGLGAISAARLCEDAIHMGLDGGLAHEEIPSNLDIRAAGGDKAKDLSFSLGQPIRKWATPGDRSGQVRNLH
jgi:hypothetical protein